MHSKTEVGIVLVFLAIPFALLWSAIGDGVPSPLLLAAPVLGIAALWYFLRYPWWLKLLLSIVYFAAFAVIDFSYSFGAACEQMSQEGRSCI